MKKQESAHENQTPESPSQPQTWKNHDLAPKTDFSFPLPPAAFPLQKDLNVQKQEFDEQNQSLLPLSPFSAEAKPDKGEN